MKIQPFELMEAPRKENITALAVCAQRIKLLHLVNKS